ncbi:alpha/beta hydrolase family protein [Rhodohalobacter halophilus]|uniref:alpha/beta hydrolase family protein n=1 Tax=Rhodohalobacter halophilus TaxID=1812810 RepID=UPI00083FD16A|nr:alpha/beta hydrolase [Rhodohalobacter halophilus]
MPSNKIEFKGALGEMLSAKVDMPDGDHKACALFAHCFTCSKNLKAVGNIAKALNEKGVAVFRFDFTGLGDSEGSFEDTNFSSNVDDLVAASEYMKKEMGAPSILIGHSLGGAAVIQAAHKIDSVKAVATIGAPSSPEHVAKHFESKKEEIEKEGAAIVNLAGRPFRIKKQFLDDLEASKMDEYIRNLDRALMVMHSPLDDTVGLDNAAHIYKTAKHPKSFISLHEADHLLLDETYSRYAGSIIAEWSSIYL